MRKQKEVLKALLAGNRQALNEVAESTYDIRQLAKQPGYEQVRKVVSGLYYAAAEMALDEPERAAEFRGVREGIKLFLDLVDDEVATYEEAQKALVELVDEPISGVDSVPSTDLIFGRSQL